MSTGTLSSDRRNTPFIFRLMRRSINCSFFRSHTNRSGMTIPEAIDSPRPQLASMTTWSFLLIGSMVNMIPDETASTMRCTTTAIPVAVWSTPRS